jgi:hypothetical protein
MKSQSNAQRVKPARTRGQGLSQGLDGPGRSFLARRTIPEKTVAADPHRKRVYDSIVDLIANPDNPTPMVKLSERFNSAPDFDIYVKLDGFNPFGSIKDRTALYLLRGTHLKEDQVLAEPTAGNTGIALAALANAQGTPRKRKTCCASWVRSCLKWKTNCVLFSRPKARAAWSRAWLRARP